MFVSLEDPAQLIVVAEGRDDQPVDHAVPQKLDLLGLEDRVAVAAT